MRAKAICYAVLTAGIFCAPVIAEPVQRTQVAAKTNVVVSPTTTINRPAAAKPAVVQSKTGAKSIEGVKTAAVDESATTAAPKPVAPKPAGPSLTLSIDLTGQRLVVRENGTVRHSFAISSGRRGYRTPTGTYRPQWTARMHYSKKYHNSPMPYSVFFHKGYAIHGTGAIRGLGAPASHGCIRLAPGNAKKVYKLVHKHGKSRTRISIYGVAKDRPRKYAKRKTYKKKTNSWFSQPSYGYAKKKKRKKAPSYAAAYFDNNRMTWPGDRRAAYRPRYGYGY